MASHEASESPPDSSVGDVDFSLWQQERAGALVDSQLLRDRAKSQFPSVLLTLTSVIQAMALETLWSRVSALAERDGFAALPLDTWLQASALFGAIAVLWIYYAQLVMRLVWVPRLADSLVPFVLGLGQFFAADGIGHPNVAQWLAPFPLFFILSHASWNWTIARAAKQPENAAMIAAYFDQPPFVRHAPTIGSVTLLVVMTFCVWVWPGSSTGVLATLDLILVAQIVLQGRYWRETVAD